MNENKVKMYFGSYAVFWLWLVVVSIAFALCFIWIQSETNVFSQTLIRVSRDLGFPPIPEMQTTVEYTIKVILFVLLWWRLVKVLVLMGSPISWGMNVSNGRQDGGSSGRLVNFMYIGNQRSSQKRLLWYGAVFRAHPTSDKLMRMRLEFLLIALPYGIVFMVNESRLFLRVLNHDVRWDVFTRSFRPYIESLSVMKPDVYRRRVVDSLRKISREISDRRVDGLTWVFSRDSLSGYVYDQFGFQISFEHISCGRYEVSELGPQGDQTATVNSVDELRRLAQNELNPSDAYPLDH